MAFFDQIYDLPQGAMVEIQLNETAIRGEFNLVTQGSGRNPNIDQVHIDGPIEVATGKQRNGAVSVTVKDILNVNVVEYGIFKKKREYEVAPISPQSSQSKSSKTSSGGKSSVSSKKGKMSQEIKDLEPVEIMLRTYVIREESKLKLLLKLLKEVDACGLAFEGQNIGRHGVVAWIVLTAGKTLIPIDMDSLSEKMPNLWNTLEKDLFCNPKLVKIMHDSRGSADYLFHAHGIRMINIFDTQVCLSSTMLEKMTRCTEAHMDSYRNQTKEKYASMPKDTKHLPEELLSTLEEDLGQLII